MQAKFCKFGTASQKIRAKSWSEVRESLLDRVTAIHCHGTKMRLPFIDSLGPVDSTAKQTFFGLELEFQFPLAPRLSDPEQRVLPSAPPGRLLTFKELCTIHADLLNKHFNKGEPRAYLEQDGSVEWGAEFITAPHTEAAFPWGNLREYLKALEDAGCEASESKYPCGLHIHISKRNYLPRDKGSSEERRILIKALESKTRAFLAKLGPDIRRVSGRRRWSYAYITAPNVGEDNDRYQALNCCNSGTYEFRFPAATLDPIKVKALVRLCIGILDYCHARGLQYIYNTSPEDLLKDFLPRQSKEVRLLWSRAKTRDSGDWQLPTYSKNNWLQNLRRDINEYSHYKRGSIGVGTGESVSANEIYVFWQTVSRQLEPTPAPEVDPNAHVSDYAVSGLTSTRTI